MRCLFNIPFFICFLVISSLSSQTNWRPATILLEGKSIHSLLNLGIAFDHGHYHPGESFTGDFTIDQLESIHAAGFKINLNHYHSLDSRNAPDNCEYIQDIAPVYPLPSYYEFGSLNGFLNLQEIYQSLELMEALYPHLITVKKPIGNYRTFDNNQIFYVKISDNPNLDENEPEVLFTALHHSREPLSMSQMMFFMWHLLENYSRNPEIAKLVNNRELFFIPCVNPDGYLFNEFTDPSGGGMWRKNRNPNIDGIGTDLNRNYSEGWAFDNSGSSPDGTSETYRGTNAFSEIETKALRDFCESRQISIAMNYHSFGNKLIIPWGYLDKPTADSTLYLRMADEMARYNKYEIGTSTQTLAYLVNGVADDWMYGEQKIKNKTFAFTPEVGYAFWPERKDIIRLNQDCQYMNFMAAWNAGECAHIKEKSAIAITSDTNYLKYDLSRTGIQNAAINIQFESDKPYVRFLQNNLSFHLNAGELKNIEIAYVIEGNPRRGDSIQFTAKLNTGIYSETNKVTKTFTGMPGWSEKFVDDKDWFTPNGRNWKLTEESFVTPPNSLTDSPLAKMDPNTVKIFQSIKTIDLRNAKYAYLRFNAKWELADDLDFAQVRMADNSLNFRSLCGRFTKEGSFSQQFQEPVFCGKQTTWVTEWMNLQDYLGKIAFLQILLSTGDNIENLDGFYFDDMEIFTDLSTQVLNETDNWISKVYPQPAHDVIYIDFRENTSASDCKLQLVSASGKLQQINYQIKENTFHLETSSLVPGLYFLSIRLKDEIPKLIKIVIQ